MQEFILELVQKIKLENGFSLIEQKEKLIKDKNNIQDKIKILQNNIQVNQDKEKADKVIEEFLKFENPSKKILFELIDRIELDEFKNIYIYFNFSELNIVKEQLNNRNFFESA